MFAPPIRRLAAWLCLVAWLWTGLVPGRGFVLCVEADGCVNLEVAVGARCSGCADRCASHEPVALEGEGSVSKALLGDDAGDAAMSTDSDCPCVDIALPGADNDRLRAKSLQPDDALVAARATAALPSSWPEGTTRPRSVPPPRPPSLLLRRASVVLLV